MSNDYSTSTANIATTQLPGDDPALWPGLFEQERDAEAADAEFEQHLTRERSSAPSLVSSAR
ncbi:MAG: hypothetical protein ACRDRR_11250 [Pseudonocardiaceae bacterium]